MSHLLLLCCCLFSFFHEKTPHNLSTTPCPLGLAVKTCIIFSLSLPPCFSFVVGWWVDELVDYLLAFLSFFHLSFSFLDHSGRDCRVFFAGGP
ncbi:hypothetical protein K457DRAFT_381221 [Linnemannia elongata AG-77]|uniref:Secreted protein n=1 Tax=Linnemannia elongata AG-77 TaxID=1314771 RepID=A0A197KHZ7_9FUNG|nr:hypothetical protein K457DRAFT_381221 [Linnemannia elongata AG-77]